MKGICLAKNGLCPSKNVGLTEQLDRHQVGNYLKPCFLSGLISPRESVGVFLLKTVHISGLFECVPMISDYLVAIINCA